MPHTATPTRQLPSSDEPLNKRSPWSRRVTALGRAQEISDIVAELLQALTDDEWEVTEELNGEAPIRLTKLTRCEEWLVVVVTRSCDRRPALPQQYEVLATGSVSQFGLLNSLVDSIPFTPLELDLLARDMPVTSSSVERAHQWIPSLPSGDAKPLAGHGAIFTIHHQTDFLVLLIEAMRLGVDPSLVTVIDKEYNYRYSRRVDAHLRHRLGIPVFPYSDLTTGLSDHIVRVERAREEAGAETWTPTIIVDDGGYILPVLRSHFQPFLNLFRGVVEQTTSGIWALRPFIDDVELPIFSVAESELKSTVEAQGVAMAALTALRRLLPNERFDGRSAVVVGFGTIGQALAELLRRHNFSVWVTDSAASKVVTAQERGFNVAVDVAEAIEKSRPSYVFSCAEPRAVESKAFSRIRDDCCLVSLTSRDYAFDKEALTAGFSERPCGNVGTLFTDDEGGYSILLVANGFPVNFHFAESMPNQQSDLIMASLLVGAMALAVPGTLWPPGNDSARANGVLNDGALLGDFLDSRPGFAVFGER